MFTNDLGVLAWQESKAMFMLFLLLQLCVFPHESPLVAALTYTIVIRTEFWEE